MNERDGAHAPKATPRPRGLSAEYAAQFTDPAVAVAYANRPPYPAEVFDVLEGLAVEPRIALDAGCGTGDITVPLARRVRRVDAVDPSIPMLAAARSRPGGADPRIRWITGRMEDVPLAPPYGLATAGESLHWMNWSVVLPRMGQVLSPDGALAIVGRQEEANPWWSKALELITSYSTNREYKPYDLVSELENRGLYRQVGTVQTGATVVEQTIGEYIESIHSRNGFSRDRMAPGAQRAFDGALRDLLAQHAADDRIRFLVRASITWGRPSPP